MDPSYSVSNQARADEEIRRALIRLLELIAARIVKELQAPNGDQHVKSGDNHQS